MFSYIWPNNSTPSNRASETQWALEFPKAPKFTFAIILAFLQGGGMEHQFSKTVLSADWMSTYSWFPPVLRNPSYLIHPITLEAATSIPRDPRPQMLVRGWAPGRCWAEPGAGTEPVRHPKTPGWSLKRRCFKGQAAAFQNGGCRRRECRSRVRGEQSWLKEMSTGQDALARDPWIHVIITEANLLH